MPSKPTDVDAISVTMTEDGTVTLSGLNYHDLRSILVAASLYAHDDKPRVEPLDGTMDDVRHENNMQNVLYAMQRRLVLEVIEGRLDHAISPDYGQGERKVRSAKEDFAYKLKNLDSDVRRLEAKAVTQKAEVDPLADIHATMLRLVGGMNTELAKLASAAAKR